MFQGLVYNTPKRHPWSLHSLQREGCTDAAHYAPSEVLYGMLPLPVCMRLQIQASCMFAHGLSLSGGAPLGLSVGPNLCDLGWHLFIRVLFVAIASYIPCLHHHACSLHDHVF